MKKGKITPNGVSLEKHEYDTILFLTNLGHDIELIPRSTTCGVQTPDIIMNGIGWEIKSPKGKGKWLIKNTIQNASHQSENIIIDLRRIKINQTKCLSAIERQFKFSKRIKKILVITKDRKLLDFYK